MLFVLLSYMATGDFLNYIQFLFELLSTSYLKNS